MTLWHVQKLYTSDDVSYQVLPYNFIGMIKSTLKMKNGIRAMMKFLLDSRLTENAADLLCETKNS